MSEENAEIAASANLNYVSDEMPGFGRRRCGRGFMFLDEEGDTIRDDAVKQRIKALVIPPAWEEVWICPDPDGHLQATGRDEAGRKQYIYHERWREIRDADKFDQLIEFARTLPRLRRRYDRDMRRRSLCRERVLAIAARFLDAAYLRVGNDAYARETGGHGLTTLTRSHIKATSTSVTVDFPAKSGQQRTVVLRDRRLARQVQACLAVPGERLLYFIDDEGDVRRPVASDDVNEYLREVMGEVATAKYFRTWGGTVAAVKALLEQPRPQTEKDAEQAYLRARDEAAQALGNTVSVAEEFYIHPTVEEACLSCRLWKLAENLAYDDDETLYSRAEEVTLKLLETAEC